MSQCLYTWTETFIWGDAKRRCQSEAQVRGLCRPHYALEHRLGNLDRYPRKSDEERGKARRTGIKPKPPCSVAGCWRLSRGRGLCRRHYAEAKANGTLPESRALSAGLANLAATMWRPLPRLPCRHCGEVRPMRATGYCAECRAYRRERGRFPERNPEPSLDEQRCIADGCGRLAVARGYCNSHYEQRRRGRPLTPLEPQGGKRKVTPELLERLRSRRAEGVSYERLAEEFGLGIETVHRHLNRKESA